MIGYKATYNGWCLGQFYEVGQTYTLNGELVMCVNGFHFCQDLFDIFNYYPPNKNLKVFKVESLEDTITNDDKSIANKLKILEEVNLSNLKLEKNGKKYEFNSNGKLSEYLMVDGYWEKYEYDEESNLIKREDSDGCWSKYEYDENKNRIKFEDSTGYWEKCEYNETNKLIKKECSDGYSVKY